MLHVSRETALPAESELPKKAAHDASPPPALLEFMVTEWEPRNKTIEPLAQAGRFAGRRQALSAQFPGEVLVIPTGHEKVRSNDTGYRFRPGTDFYYLTGNVEPDCVLVFAPSGRGHIEQLYVEPNPGKTDASFFTDRAKGELWVGPRLGVRESEIRYGISTKPICELEEDLKKLALDTPSFRVVAEIDGPLASSIPHGPETDATFATNLSEMRLIKDAYEITELERAINATQRGFEDVLRALPRSLTERHVEGIFNLRARVEGNDVGYNTIAAAGKHACTLHWTSNDGPIADGELLLLDAGVEAETLYTADITRTVPIGGTFSKEQREIYDLVYAAQEAAFAECKAGNAFLAPNEAAMKVIAYGLERLGILPMPAQEALLETNMFYKRYSLHGVSHMLGLDVHDCAKAREENYKYGTLEMGMVLTVEPGIYLQVDDKTVPERYRGIGVRIEDDIVITQHGFRNLSGGIPRRADDVETWMRRCQATAPTL